MKRLALILFILPLYAQASYRVYQLKIQSYDYYGKLNRNTVVMSSLDPYQYEHYYGGYRWMRVTMLDTWYCPGDTSGYRAFCKRPVVVDRAPASFDHAKRSYLPYTRQPIIP